MIDNFEIIAEPDGGWAFLGTPQQYASTLSASCIAIHAADPEALVTLGGLMNIGASGKAWMDAVLATPSADALRRCDIARIQIRAPDPVHAGPLVRSWRALLRQPGPSWTAGGYRARGRPA